MIMQEHSHNYRHNMISQNDNQYMAVLLEYYNIMNNASSRGMEHHDSRNGCDSKNSSANLNHH